MGNRDLKIPWSRRWIKRGFGGESLERGRSQLGGKNKLRLSRIKECFRWKNREALLHWYLNDLLLVETFVPPAMIPVSLKDPEFLWGKLEGMMGVQVISYLLPDFTPFRCSWLKTIFRPLHRWTESEQNKIIKVNKWTMASCSRSQFSPKCSSLLQA